MFNIKKFLFGTFVFSSCASVVGCNTVNYKTTTSELHVKTSEKDIYGLVTKPLNGKEKNPLVICSHGYNGNEEIFESLVNALSPKGYVIYRLNFCGGSNTSKSSGKTTEMSLFTEKDELNLVIDAAKKWDFVDTNNIYLLGESQGGVVTNMIANSRSDIKGIVLWYPAFSIPDMVRNMLLPAANNPEKIPETITLMGMLLGKVYYLGVKDYYPYKDMNNINYKVLIVHGTNDTVIPLSVSEEAQKVYKNCELVKIQGANHCFFDENFTYNELYMKEALEATLKYFK
jgi:Dipeptidyl aminopeptidases/acylaminoacyl-peptidases